MLGVGALWSLAALTLLAARWIDPPTTAVQFERRLQTSSNHRPNPKGYKFVPLGEISSNLQHAVIAAEDARFYQHHGFDWNQIEIDAKGDLEGGRTRGASTLTQQLVKNLFFGTGRSILRKGAEFTLVPVAELVGQAADSGALPQRGRMGAGNLWGGGGLAGLLRYGGAESRPGAGGATGCDPAGSAEAAARADEPLQRADPGADEPDGMVIAARSIRFWFVRGPSPRGGDIAMLFVRRWLF